MTTSNPTSASDALLDATRLLLDDSFATLLAQLEGPAEALNWRPEALESNSLAGICMHALRSARSWLLVARGTPLTERQRGAEFGATVEDADAFRAEAAALIDECKVLLETMPRPFDAAVMRHSHRRRDPNLAHDMTAAWALLHVVDHLREHVGQMMLTRSLWQAQAGSAAGRYRAVVFDMDGVIADSEPAYYAAINLVLAPLGKHMDDALQRRIMGSRMTTTWEMLAEALELTGPLDALIEAYDIEVRRLLEQIHETLPGARELIAAVRERGLPLGLASSSQPGWIEALLRGVGLTTAFDTVVSASMVAHGKPAPDIYLLAAERLGVPAAECLAIEDTPTGLGASKAAGMFSIQTRSASSAFPPQDLADLVLETLHEFDFGLLDGA